MSRRRRADSGTPAENAAEPAARRLGHRLQAAVPFRVRCRFRSPCGLADFTCANYLKPQTRELVQLLADDVTGRMIVALRAAPHTAPQLEEVAGSSQKTVAARLGTAADPRGHRVNATNEPKAAGGRPSRVWQLVAEDELAMFERACDAFKAGLLRRLIDDYDDDNNET